MVQFFVIFLACYVWHTLGVTIGYHRLLSHRSFTCPKPVEYFFVLAGYLALEGSPIWWATMHRAHHRHVDTPLDPHSPRYGLRYAHTGWIHEKGYAAHINPALQSKDLLKDPIYRFLEQDGDWNRAYTVAVVINIAFRAIILLCFGWLALLASVVATVLVNQIPLMLNVVCHIPKLGYKRFASEDDSVNVWWVALLALGEGWHNNHHAFPGSAKSGIGKWEIDISWMVIWVMEKLNLANNVNIITGRRSTYTAKQPVHARVVEPARMHALRKRAKRSTHSRSSTR